MPPSKPADDPANARPAPGEIVLHEGLTLLETDDPVLLVELQSDSRVAASIVALLSPCAAVVKAGDAPALAERLLKTGHLPKVSEL
ncbi:MAG: hypothetical protein ACK47B_01590 [Armatimonadota bacterium]